MYIKQNFFPPLYVYKVYKTLERKLNHLIWPECCTFVSQSGAVWSQAHWAVLWDVQWLFSALIHHNTVITGSSSVRETTATTVQTWWRVKAGSRCRMMSLQALSQSQSQSWKQMMLGHTGVDQTHSGVLLTTPRFNCQWVRLWKEQQM